MKKLPAQITPIFLWQRADHLDTMQTEGGNVDVFEYQGETFYLLKNGIVCYENDLEYFIAAIVEDENYEENDFTFTPWIRSNA